MNNTKSEAIDCVLYLDIDDCENNQCVNGDYIDGVNFYTY